MNHGAYRWVASATGVTARPNRANTAAKPIVIAAALVSARTTAAPRDRRASPMTRNDRYTGSIANPHGLSAATLPAATASASGRSPMSGGEQAATRSGTSSEASAPRKVTFPAASMNTNTLCAVTPNRFHTVPGSSAMVVIAGSLASLTNSGIASVLSRPATPTMLTLSW